MSTITKAHPFTLVGETEQEHATLSMNSTRDNFVRHALTTKTCPICSKPIVDRVPLACRCGFTVGAAELERHSLRG